MLSQARFSSIIFLSALLIPYTIYLIWKDRSLAFRWVGALKINQMKYCLLNLCFSSVTFDLQAQVHPQIQFSFLFALVYQDLSIIFKVKADSAWLRL